MTCWAPTPLCCHLQRSLASGRRARGKAEPTVLSRESCPRELVSAMALTTVASRAGSVVLSTHTALQPSPLAGMFLSPHPSSVPSSQLGLCPRSTPWEHPSSSLNFCQRTRVLSVEGEKAHLTVRVVLRLSPPFLHLTRTLGVRACACAGVCVHTHAQLVL